MHVCRVLGVLLLCAPLFACSVSGTGMNPGPRPTPSGKIKHIVIIIQENRTVDNLFNGLKGADTVRSGLDHKGHVVPFHVVGLEDAHDVCHDHTCWVVTYDRGKLDGFDLNHPDGTNPHYAYAMTDPAETVPYFAMAQTYAFADRFFQTNSGPSYPAHQYLIAGQSARVDENPNDPTNFDGWGCDSPSGTTTEVLASNGQDVPGPFPCFNYPTLADEMDRLGVTWRYYAPAIGTSGGVWSGYDAVTQIRHGPDWTNDVISPETKILTVRVFSFSFHRGSPKDETGNGGGFVFDARSLPNPGREERFKPFTGKDAPVIGYLNRQESVHRFLASAASLVDASLSNYQSRGFKNLMISFGCTGGQHRSVYLAEALAKHLRARNGINVVVRHLELEKQGK